MDRHRINFTIVIGLAAMAILALVVQSFGAPNPDVSWINFGVNAMLDGKRLYRDIVEVNPPLIYYLSTPPFIAARALMLDGQMPYNLWIVALALISAAVTHATLKSLPRGWIIVLTHGFCGLLLVGESFGQREHLTYLFLAPCVTMIAATCKGGPISNRLKMLVGLFAALAVALKPHYFAVLIFAQAAALMRHGAKVGPFLPSIMAFAVACIALIIAMFLLHPEFFSEMVPLARMAYLPFYHESAQAIFRLFGALAFCLAIAAFFEWRDGISGAGPVFLGASAGAALSMLLQFRGFPYHLLPSVFLLILWAAYRVARSSWRERTVAPLIPAIAAAGFLLGTNSLLAFSPRPPFSNPDWSTLTKRTSVAVVSTSIRDAFPWVPFHGLNWGLRYPSYQFFPFVEDVLRRKAAGENLGAAETDLARKLVSSTIDDLMASKPEFIFVDEAGSQLFSAPPSLLSLLSTDERFPNFMSRYKLEWQRDGFAAYRRVSPN